MRDETSALTDALDAMKSQVEEVRRKADDDAKRAVDKALEKARKEKGTLDESAAAELRTKLDAAQVRGRRVQAAGADQLIHPPPPMHTQAAVRQLSESSAEVVQAKSAAEEDARSLREQLIKREKKLSSVLQVREG